MLLRLTTQFIEKNISRWFVLFLDTFLCFISFGISYALLFSQRSEVFNLDGIINPLIILLLFRLQAFVFTKSYTGIIKYTGTQDAIRITTAIGLSTIAFVLVSYLFQLNTEKVFVSNSIIVLDLCLSIILLTSFRVGAKILYKELTNNSGLIRKNIVIYGAGKSGVILKRTLEAEIKTHNKIIAFIDDNSKLVGKSAEGAPVYFGIKKLAELNQKYKIDELILAIPHLNARHKRTIIEKALEQNIRLKSIPPIESWSNGEFNSNEIKNVAIEDLLGREPIELNNDNINSAIEGKVILITGAAGSIGSEIVRQCLHFRPSKIIALDQAETPIHDLHYELNSNRRVIPVIADIRNKERLNSIFDRYRPHIVFHAAAYKHVPLMEENPYEAIQTNVFGSKIVADVAVKFEVEKFIYISTDKAVNPTNIMGASKRISEIYVQSLNATLELDDLPHTRFITTRFGNVLGSNGSVIPRFKEQIDKGGPLTVTHPEINRYFMTIPEACQLVLEAGAMGNGGEIYIFDMGEPVRIIDLAEKMIRLSGLKPYIDIDILFTGLRPGEKLKEELLNDKENTIGTHHPKIMIAKVAQYNFLEINQTINSMNEANTIDKSRLLVSIMKQIVPEYISNNSIYEQLDRKISTS
jgi:FlaA1/EpsC-like NDP-sugar epimerase